MQNMMQIEIRGWAGWTPSLSLFLVLPIVFLFVYSSDRVLPHHWTDLDARWLLERVFCQGSAFWGLDDEKKCLGVKIPLKRKFWGANRRFKPNLRNVRSEIFSQI